MQYLGSKRRLAKGYWELIKKHVPITEDTYFVDLFCGGCNMVANVPLKNRIANDISTPLIAYFKKIQEDTSWMPKSDEDLNLTRERYDYIRKNKGKFKDFFLGYIGYSLSFNGNYFQGWMKPQKYSHIRRAYKSAVKDSAKIQNVKFYNTDYEDVPIPPKSIIFCDIPYKNTAKYLSDETDFDYERFYRYAKRMKDAGHYVFLCEYDDDVPSHFQLIGEFVRKSTMKNCGRSRRGKKFV